jgi:transcriptional regulatory protein LevR
MIYKEQPSVIYTQTKQRKRNKLVMTKNDFAIGVSIEDDYGARIPVDETIFILESLENRFEKIKNQ